MARIKLIVLSFGFFLDLIIAAVLHLVQCV